MTLVACMLASQAFAMEDLDSMSESLDKVEEQADMLIESGEQMMDDSTDALEETVEQVKEDIDETVDEVIVGVDCPKDVSAAVFDGLAAPGHILSEIHSLQQENEKMMQNDPDFQNSQDYKDNMLIINKTKEMLKPTRLKLDCTSVNCEKDETLEFAYSFELDLFPNCNNYKYNVDIKFDDNAHSHVMMEAKDSSQKDLSCEADNTQVIIPITPEQRKACIQDWGETIYMIHEMVKE